MSTAAPALNRLKSLWREGRTTLGAIATIPSVQTMQVLARSGLDWVVIDMVHGAIDAGTAHAMIVATSDTPMVPFVRVASTSAWHAKVPLDLGALGICFPMTTTGAAAAAAASAVRYPPKGERFCGPLRLYRLTLDRSPRNTQPRYNVCPTDAIDTIVDRDGERELVPMHWGLVPRRWSKLLKDVKMATFNARAETVETKPFFRDAFKRTRCLIPVSGYYEWQNTSDGKQPWYFTARDGSPALTVAGLWDEWRNKENGETLKSCAMIKTEPNKLVAEVHDRMPVLLAEKDFGPWLTGAAGVELLRPAA